MSKFSCSSLSSGVYPSRLFRATRRVLPAAKLMAALFSSAGCVPELKYEEARSAAEVEGEARRRAALELERTRGEVARLQAELRARDEKLQAKDGNLQEAKFDQDQIAKQRDESAFLVDQLRGELARVGGHLQASVEEANRLERELGQARANGDTASVSRLELVRDLALAVGSARLEHAVAIRPEADSVVLRVRADAIFDTDTADFRPSLLPLMASFGRPESLATWSATIREADIDATREASLGELRRTKLRALIADRAASGSIAYPAVPEGTPRFYELVLVPADSKTDLGTTPSSSQMGL